MKKEADLVVEVAGRQLGRDRHVSAEQLPLAVRVIENCVDDVIEHRQVHLRAIVIGQLLLAIFCQFYDLHNYTE